MKKLVETYDGTIAPKKNCRKYNKNYYEIGRQCFKMSDGKYHRINSGKIILDFETNKYVFKSNKYIKGIVGFNGPNPIYGYFKPNSLKNIDIMNLGLAYSENILNNYIIEDLRTNKYYLVNKDNYKKSRKKYLGGNYSKNLDYNADYRLKEITQSFNKYFNPPVVKNFWKNLPDNLTVGIEYETYVGKIPEKKCLINGLIPVKDGSLRRNGSISFEYATIILNKNTVFPAIKAQTDLLNKYCDKNINGSLHVHIGGYKKSKELLVAIYRVVCLVQDELYTMFPSFLKNTSIYKNKNYCSPLPSNYLSYEDLNKDLDYIIHILSSGYLTSDEFEIGMENPKDPDNNHKWNVYSRYKICNLNHFAFKGNNTIEFRIHTNTFNKDKIAAWLFITSAIVEYANKIKENVTFNKNINLNFIIEQVYNDKLLVSFLKYYIKYRKNLMKLHRDKYRDFIGVLDVKNDNLDDFKFPLKEII